MPTLRTHHGISRRIRSRSRGGRRLPSGTAPSSRCASLVAQRPTTAAPVASTPSVTPIEEKASCTRTGAPSGRNAAPPQVVGERPVVVLAVDVEQVERPRPARPQPGAELGLEGATVRRRPRRSTFASNLVPGRTATEQPALDEGVDRHDACPPRAQGRGRAPPSSDPGGCRSRASWHPGQPRRLVEQHPRLVRREPARERRPRAPMRRRTRRRAPRGAGRCGRDVMVEAFHTSTRGTGLDCPRQVTTR